MFCPKCGTKVPDGSSFCPSCGNRIAAAPKAAPAAASAYKAASTFKAAPAAVSAPKAAPSVSFHMPVKAQSSAAIVPVQGIVAVACAVVAAISTFMPWVTMSSTMTTATSIGSAFGVGSALHQSYALSEFSSLADVMKSYGLKLAIMGDSSLQQYATAVEGTFFVWILGFALVLIGAVMLLMKRSKASKLILIGGLAIWIVLAFVCISIGNSVDVFVGSYDAEILCMVASAAGMGFAFAA